MNQSKSILGNRPSETFVKVVRALKKLAPCNIGAIASETKISRRTISKHLRALDEAGLMIKKGNSRYGTKCSLLDGKGNKMEGKKNARHKSKHPRYHDQDDLATFLQQEGHLI